MRQTQNLLKLPAKLVQELGGDDILSDPGRKKSRYNPSSRKESRKAERSQKKSLRSGPPPQKRLKTQHTEHPTAEYTNAKPTPWRDAAPSVAQFSPMSKPKSILKRTKKPEPAPDRERSISPPPSIPRAVKHKLEEDDAEIAALEKRLGIKGKKKHLKDDEFADLLEGLDEDTDSDTQQKKISKAEGDEWLDRKRNEARRRAHGMGNQIVEENSGQSEEDLDEDDAATEDEEDEASGMSLDGPEFSDDDSDGGFDELQDDQEECDNFNETNSDEDSDQKPAPRVRENPYIAPTTRYEAAPAKYIPPSLRKPASSDSEALLRLRRQMQGLVNRLTEANLISILSDIERIYRDNARQHVTSTLVDLLLTQVCEPTSLPDTSIIVPAGFISAVYKIIGTDFGAQVIQRIVELFDKHYSNATAASKDSSAAPTSDSSKETSNLITLLSQLYNFQVVGSNLMFDYARLLLEKLSELNTELLLKLVRVSGPQLRQDDPSALKGIVTMLRQAVSKVGEENISVRTSYMIETIDDLKNNRMKTGAAASAVTSEHTIRMKKTLGTLNSRTIKGSEPLRIGLQDIQDSDKKGKWWLVGASWLGKDAGDASTSQSETPIERKRTAAIMDNGTSDLVQLASEQRMNTDIRRAIFITIMSASDYQDAYLRLMKLKLKRVQELEIPKILIRCAGGEQGYNPYYTLIAQRLCGDRKLKMAFQFGLWDLFKKMGETSEDINDHQGDDEEDILDARRLVNLAKMFGTLIVEGGLGLSVLKNLSLSYLQPKTKIFLEVLFITILLRSQRQSETKKDDQAILNIFAKAKDTPQLITGLQYFLKKVVAKTDIAGGKTEKVTVRWACKVALKSLQAIVAMDDAED